MGAVDGQKGATAWGTGWVTGEEVLGKGLEDGNLGALQALALGEVAGCRVGNPEEELGVGNFHPDGLVMGRGGSAGGGGGGDDGGHWGGDGGGGCCCCCSGGGCCGRDGGESNGLSGHADVSLED